MGLTDEPSEKGHLSGWETPVEEYPMWKMQSSKLIFFLSCISYVLFYIDDIIPYGRIITGAVFLLMLVVFAVEREMKFRFSLSSYLIYIFAFACFCLASKIWAEDPSLANGKIRRLFILFGMMFILYYSLKDRNDVIQQMLKVIMYGGFCVVLFAYLKYGVKNILYLLSHSERLSNDYFNANSIGLCAAYSIVINVFFLIYRKKKISVQELLLVPAVVILAASESRKALVGAILGVFALVILKNLNNRNIMKSFVRILVISLALILLLYAILQLPAFSGILTRMEGLFATLTGKGAGDASSWIRFQYNQLGWSLFKQRPLLGIGICNANRYTLAYFGHDHYLHNNYIELLACGGLIGFFLYYSMYLYLIVIFLKYRKNRDPEYDVCFVLMTIVLLLDYGLVSYYSPSRYFFLMLFWLEGRKIANRSYLGKRQQEGEALSIIKRK